MSQKSSRPKIAIIGLTSCEGCQFVMLDQGRKFLDWLEKVELSEFRLLEDQPMKKETYDLCLVEGNPVTKENIKLLKEMRKRSKYLVVVGNCAALGGVWELKNYQNKKRTIRQVYHKLKAPNPDIKEVDNFVKVDAIIPGCPINGQEFLDIVNGLIEGKSAARPQNPVCRECQARGYECLLQKGEICLGPIAWGGCEAVCLKSKQACWGCRGLVAGAPVQNFMNYLLKHFTREEIYRVLEVFGVKDSILAELAREEKATTKSKKTKTKK